MTQTARTITTTTSDALSYRLSVRQYHDMIRAGILNEDDGVELIEGVLVRQMAKNPPHKIAKRKLITLLDRLLPPGWFYQPEDPITLADGEPEPDGAVVRGKVDDYFDRNAGPADVALVIEVSDTSLAFDRGTKLHSYARAGIVTYWIVNLAERQVEVYTLPLAQPAEPTYADRADFGENDSVPIVLDGQTVGTIAVRDVLP